MIDAPFEQIEVRAGFFARRGTCRLTDQHVEILNGARVNRIKYVYLAAIRIAQQGEWRTVLGLSTTSGQNIQLRLVRPSGSEAAADFMRSLISRVAQVAPEIPLRLGPSRGQRVAAWVGLVTSVAILFGAGWTLFTGGPVGLVLLPLGIALVNLRVVVWILKTGQAPEFRVCSIAALQTGRDSCCLLRACSREHLPVEVSDLIGF